MFLLTGGGRLAEEEPAEGHKVPGGGGQTGEHIFRPLLHQ